MFIVETIDLIIMNLLLLSLRLKRFMFCAEQKFIFHVTCLQMLVKFLL